jgi:hypothetical protein
LENRATLPTRSAESWAHARLPCRPDRDTLQETWLVYYDDIHVGTIAVRSGIRHDQPQWGWRRVFYPGCRHCVSFEAARAAFEAAWRAFLANWTEADFQACRD